MFTTYVLENPKGKRYIGSTIDFQERLATHNDTSPAVARFHKTTYKKGPWTEVFSREFGTRGEAAAFERYLKTGKGREWLRNFRASYGSGQRKG